MPALATAVTKSPEDLSAQDFVTLGIIRVPETVVEFLVRESISLIQKYNFFFGDGKIPKEPDGLRKKTQYNVGISGRRIQG